MSRIDEALKRAAPHGSLGGRAGIRSVEVPSRLPDELSLNDYPLENRPAVRRERLEARSDVAPVRIEARTSGNAAGVQLNPKLVVNPDRNQTSTEQYRRLAATLHDAQVEKGLKTVLVTSSVPKEGKTLTVANLAYTFSESYGRRVLLVDADLRRPTVHEVLGVANDCGLSEVLRSSDRLEPRIVAVSPRLSVLCSGQPDQNPLAGLSSPRMRQLLDDAAKRFDWVLLDSPPVGLLSDAQLLSRLAQAVIFVIRAGATPFSVIDRAIGELGRDCIVGTVLNGVDERTIPATSYYGEYYGRRHDRSGSPSQTS